MSDQIKTIFRTVKRENPYVQIDKTVINDPRLSWKAKGLMAFLLSKPDDWEVNVLNLTKQSRDGKDAVYSALNELIRFGYVRRREHRNNGKFAEVEYLIYENPQLFEEVTVDHPKIGAGKNEEAEAVPPLPGKPDTENPNEIGPEMVKPVQPHCDGQGTSYSIVFSKLLCFS
jgi:hypothetical protein